MNKRKERQDQFKNRPGDGVFWPLSPMLFDCAHTLLNQALYERRHASRDLDNHYAPHAVGSIILVMNGLEAWFNELILRLSMSASVSVIDLADTPIVDKYYTLPRRMAGVEIPQHPDLETVIDLRNEIAHYLPRVIDRDQLPPEDEPISLEEVIYHRERYIPPRLKRLARQGLLWPSKSRWVGRTEVSLSTQLCSYRLAYWTWETLDEAMTVFLKALENIVMFKGGYPTFKRYESVCPPSKLPEYDVEYGLETE